MKPGKSHDTENTGKGLISHACVAALFCTDYGEEVMTGKFEGLRCQVKEVF